MPRRTRLAYVGILCRRRHIYLTPPKRTLFGGTSMKAASRFITEIPTNSVESLNETAPKRVNIALYKKQNAASTANDNHNATTLSSAFAPLQLRPTGGEQIGWAVEIKLPTKNGVVQL